MSLPILYTFRRCPYAMRARLALYTARVSHEHREVDLKNKPSAMLAISPKGTVPVLQLSPEAVLEQSLDIMQWALGIPSLPLEQSTLIHENDTAFKRGVDLYKYPGRYPGETATSPTEVCEAFLNRVEKRLDPFLSGTTIALIDMAIFPFIRQFAMVDPQRFSTLPYPKLKIWLDTFISSPLFHQVMQTFSPWSPGDEPGIVSF